MIVSTVRLSITVVSIIDFNLTLGIIDNQHNDTQHNRLNCDNQHKWPPSIIIKSHFALCSINVSMLNVVILDVMAPISSCFPCWQLPNKTEIEKGKIIWLFANLIKCYKDFLIQFTRYFCRETRQATRRLNFQFFLEKQTVLEHWNKYLYWQNDLAFEKCE